MHMTLIKVTLLRNIVNIKLKFHLTQVHAIFTASSSSICEGLT